MTVANIMLRYFFSLLTFHLSLLLFLVIVIKFVA